MLRRHICISLAIALAVSTSAVSSPPHLSVEPPTASVLDKIEQRLRSSSCVGDLGRWDRRYAYHQWMQGTVYSLDVGMIDFMLSEAGKYKFKAGRRFIDGPLVTGSDDRAYNVVFGSYDLLRDRLAIRDCGPNR